MDCLYVTLCLLFYLLMLACTSIVCVPVHLEYPFVFVSLTIFSSWLVAPALLFCALDVDVAFSI